MKLEVENNPFSKSEVAFLQSKKAYLGDIKSLEEYCTMPHFSIIRFFKDRSLCGYAVVFLGYNGLESNDVSLEDIAYFEPDIIPVQEFLKIVKASEYPIPVENFYYNSEHICGYLQGILDDLGFKSTTRTR